MSESSTQYAKILDDNGLHVATRDLRSGTEYADAGSAKYMTADKAFEAARKLDLLGGGWQPACAVDVVPIIDYSRHNPAVDPECFPWIKPDWYWLFDNEGRAAWSSASAWFVSFSDGYVCNLRRSLNGFALAVRRAGQ